MAGLSTSEDHLAGAAREPRRLTREEFGDRVFAYAQTRYGLKLNKGWFADLIKDAFYEWENRQPNIGIHPIYSYDWRWYRRSLQLVRLYAHGVTDRAALRIMLFAKSYADWDIREDLARQYIKHARSLSAQVRSKYVDAAGDIPDVHKASLMEKLGPLDARLEAAGLRLRDHTYINWFRTAKKPTDAAETQLPRLPLDELVFNRPSARSSVIRFLFSVARGLLAVKFKPIAVEKMIRTASLDELEQARHFYELVASKYLQLAFAEVGIKICRRAFEAIAFSVKNDPRWASMILVMGLVLGRYSPVKIDLAELNLRLQRYDGPKWNLDDLLPIFYHR